MHQVGLEQVPLPAFSTYICFTICSLVLSTVHLSFNSIQIEILNLNQTDYERFSFVKSFTTDCLKDKWCFWSYFNFCYACLLMLGLVIQHTFFGELRNDEQSNIRDKFWNFLFYKLVFIFGVLNIKSMHSLIGWGAWSSVVGFLHLLIGLTKDRMAFITLGNVVNPLVHFKMFILILAMYFVANILLLITLYAGFNSFNTLAFMIAEVLILSVSIIEITAYYIVYFYMEVESNKRTGHPRCYQNVINYYVELVFALSLNFLEFSHNLHMLLCSSSFINISNLVIFMHLQYVYFDSHNRYTKHQEYQTTEVSLKKTFKSVTLPNTNCPICWECMKRDSIRLNCNHDFHYPCLIQWMLRNKSCPTCRKEVHFDQNQSLEDGAIPGYRTSILQSDIQNEISEIEKNKTENDEDDQDEMDNISSHQILTTDLLLLDGLLGTTKRQNSVVPTTSLHLTNLSNTIETAMEENHRDILLKLHSFSSKLKLEIETHLKSFTHEDSGFMNDI